MASRETILKDIEAFLKTNWTTTIIQFENINGKDPATPTKLLSEGTAPYLFTAIQFARSESIEVGKTFRRTNGAIYMEVRVKEGTGTRKANEYISDLQTMLEYTNINDVKIRGSASSDGFSNRGWYILPLSFTFRYDRQE